VKVRALARELAHRGHQVTVLTADLGLAGHAQCNLHLERSPWGWRMREDGVETFYLPTFGHYRALTFNPGAARYCRDSLGRFDIVHFYGLYDLLGPVVSRFCRHRGLPYVVEPMGMYRPIDRSFRMKRLWHAIVGKRHMELAARIVATSEIERQDLVEEGVPSGKIVVRYNGIDLDSSGPAPEPGAFRSKWKISPDEPMILFVSRLIPRKGADMLIEAFARACPATGKLVIAGPEGEAGYLDYLKKRAAAAGVEPRVIFPGPVYGAEKRAMFVDCTIFALPSRYENFANVVAEAVACDIPVIVSNTCGIFSLIEDRAGLVIPPERDALIEAIGALLHDRAAYAGFKAGCRELAAQLTWGTLGGQMEKYYLEVLSRGNESKR
jgi:glycosyltransferase involved in cell wall biosynthesis